MLGIKWTQNSEPLRYNSVQVILSKGEDINSSGAEDKTEYDFRVTQDGSSMEDADQNI